MIRKRRYITIVSLLVAVVFAAVPGLAQDAAVPAGDQPAGSQSVLSDNVRELWTMMHEGKMINDEQFQYVLDNGRLPGGSTVQNSPLSEERQNTWAKLNEQNLVTPEELVNVLFKGEVPNMAAWEVKAFEELAPVYEPDRRKRLTYDVRQKHQRVELIRLKHGASAEWKQAHAEAVLWAKQHNEMVRGVTQDGTVWELDRFESDGTPVYVTTANVNAARTISTDKVRLGGVAPFQLTGSNVTVAMWDGGVAVTNHQEFGGRVRSRDATSPLDHATGVAGTLAAQGVVSNAQGMAYQSNVDVYYWDDYIADMAECVASNPSIHVSNHSWVKVAGWDNSIWYYPRWHGDAALSETEDFNFGRYDQLAQTSDVFCATAVYHLPVRSCGNDRGNIGYVPFLETFGYGYHDTRLGGPNDWFTVNSGDFPRPPDGGEDGFDCVQPYGIAKNVLAVGSVDDLPNGYTNGTVVTLADYSGCGPADDGRIKPDIVANGQGVYTTFSTATNGYASKNGTSFSSPAVAGSISLLQELHERLYGTDLPLLASTLKALVIHTADDIGVARGPDYRFGWGLMNTEQAAWCITNNASWDSLPHIKEVALQDQDYIEFDVQAGTNDPLKVSIVWTDPPGAIAPYECDPTNRALVNDLDLRVITPGGSTNFPWILDPLNPTNAATTGDNYRDNVEQVVIENPTNDWYTVRVTHKGSLSNGVQDVSIIVTGNIPTNAPDFYITDMGVVGTNGLTQLEWPGVVGALYEVQTSTNLLVSNGWTNANLNLSANREPLEWIDQDSEFYGIRFYRLKRLK